MIWEVSTNQEINCRMSNHHGWHCSSYSGWISWWVEETLRGFYVTLLRKLKTRMRTSGIMPTEISQHRDQISIMEITAAISRLKLHKAEGTDVICPELFKYGAEKVAPAPYSLKSERPIKYQVFGMRQSSFQYQRKDSSIGIQSGLLTNV